jgi:uncharacterized protein with ATP-grasp and redox domains
MRIHLECIPCLIRHGFDISAQTADPAVRERFMRQVLAWASHLNYDQFPPLAAREMYAMLQRITGIHDPFVKVKEISNQKALAMYPAMKAKVETSVDPLDTALRIALAGNMIDYGRHAADGLDMDRVVSRFLGTSFAIDHRDRFRQKSRDARDILYILDNAGEIVFDRVLIEELGPDRVISVVRGAPIINDVTMKDASQVGLVDVCRVISSGSAASGTPLTICSDEFKDLFHRADLVIAKGQGNYESLHEEEREVFHLFVAKCPVIAVEVGVAEGSALACFNELRH